MAAEGARQAQEGAAITAHQSEAASDDTPDPRRRRGTGHPGEDVTQVQVYVHFIHPNIVI